MTDSEDDDISKIDFSVIASAVEAGGTMLEHIFRNAQYGTPETRHLLFHEADFILECKVCRSLFRNFPLFIAHKRLYCAQEYEDVCPNRFDLDIPQPIEDVVVIEPRPTTPCLATESTTSIEVEQEQIMPDRGSKLSPPQKSSSVNSHQSMPVNASAGQKVSPKTSTPKTDPKVRQASKPSIQNITSKLSQKAVMTSTSDTPVAVKDSLSLSTIITPARLSASAASDIADKNGNKATPSQTNSCPPKYSVSTGTDADSPGESEESTLKQLLTGKFIGKSSAYCFLSNIARKVEAAKNKQEPISTLTMTPIRSNPNAMFMTVTKNSSQSDPSNNKNTTTTTNTTTTNTTTLEVCSEMEVDSPTKDQENKRRSVTPPSLPVSVDTVTIPANTKPVQTAAKGWREMELRPVKSQNSHADELKELDLAGHCNMSTNTCNLCQLSYTAQKGLVQHMRAKHSGKQWMYPCCLCSKEFKFKWSVIRHMESYHRKNKTQIERMKGRLASLAYQINSSGNSIKTSSSSTSSVSSCSPPSPAKKVPESEMLHTSDAQRKALEPETIKLNKCEGCDKAFWKKSNFDEHVLQCKFLERKSRNGKNIPDAMTDGSRDLATERGRVKTRQGQQTQRRSLPANFGRTASKGRSSSSESSRRSDRDSVGETSIAVEVRRSQRSTRIPDRYTRSPSSDKETSAKFTKIVAGKSEVKDSANEREEKMTKGATGSQLPPQQRAASKSASLNLKSPEANSQPMRTRYFDKRRESKIHVDKTPPKSSPKKDQSEPLTSQSEKASRIRKNIEDMIEEKLSEAKSLGKELIRNSNGDKAISGENEKQANKSDIKRRSVNDAVSDNAAGKDQGTSECHRIITTRKSARTSLDTGGKQTMIKGSPVSPKPHPTLQQHSQHPGSLLGDNKEATPGTGANDNPMNEDKQDKRDKLQVLDDLKNKLLGIGEQYTPVTTSEESALGIKLNASAEKLPSSSDEEKAISNGNDGEGDEVVAHGNVGGQQVKGHNKDADDMETPREKHPASVSGKVVTSTDGYSPEKRVRTPATGSEKIQNTAAKVIEKHGKNTGLASEKERTVEVIWCNTEPGKPMTEVATCKTVLTEGEQEVPTTYRPKTQSRMYVAEQSPKTHVAYSKLKLLDKTKIDQLIDSQTNTCTQCDISFSNLSNARRHAVRHLGWQRYKCKLCKFSSYNKSECNSHLYRIHSNRIRGQSVVQFITDLKKEGSKIRSQKKQETLKQRQNAELSAQSPEPSTRSIRGKKSIETTEMITQSKNETTPNKLKEKLTSQTPALKDSDSEETEKKIRKRKRSSSEDDACNRQTAETQGGTENSQNTNACEGRPTLKRSQSLDGTVSKLNESMSDSFDIPSVSDYEMSDTEQVSSPQAKMAPNLTTMMAALEEAKAHVFVRQRGKGRRNSLPPRKLQRMSVDSSISSSYELSKETDDKGSICAEESCMQVAEEDTAAQQNETEEPSPSDTEIKSVNLKSESDNTASSVNPVSVQPDSASVKTEASVKSEVAAKKQEVVCDKSSPSSSKSSPALGRQGPTQIVSIISTRSKALESSKTALVIEGQVGESPKPSEPRTRLKSKKE